MLSQFALDDLASLSANTFVVSSCYPPEMIDATLELGFETVRFGKPLSILHFAA